MRGVFVACEESPRLPLQFSLFASFKLRNRYTTSVRRTGCWAGNFRNREGGRVIAELLEQPGLTSRRDENGAPPLMRCRQSYCASD
jgi:hypothetical protein